MSSHTYLMNKRLADTVAALEVAGHTSDHLDEAVQNAASELATAANNGGLHEQVSFLLAAGDWKPPDILFAAQQAKESDDTDDFESSQDHWSSPNGCHDDCPACAEEEANRQRVVVATGTPKFVLSRDGKMKGEVTGTRRCRLEGCTGAALSVKWPDGKRTYPCSKGTEAADDPDTVKIV